MMRSFLTDPPTIPEEARVPWHRDESASYGCDQPRARERAMADVATGRANWTEVRAPGGITFQAWRVSPSTFAWRSSAMGAPAFEEISRAT